MLAYLNGEIYSGKAIYANDDNVSIVRGYLCAVIEQNDLHGHRENAGYLSMLKNELGLLYDCDIAKCGQVVYFQNGRPVPNAKNDIRRIETVKLKGGVTLTLTAKLNDECHNGHEDFSLTYNMTVARFGRHDFMSGGNAQLCDDRRVRNAIKRLGLEPVERVHLCDMNGASVHALQNAVYWIKERELHHAQSILRLTNEEMNEVKSIDNEAGLYVWLLDHGIIARWKKEAEEAIAAIINGRDITFVSTATKPNGCIYFREPLTNERIEQERERFKSGYYANEKGEQRILDKKLAECLEYIDSFIGLAQNRINAEEMHIMIRQAMRDVLEAHFAEFKQPKLLLENSIWYSHSNEIAFNWRMFSDKVDEEDCELFVKYLEPFLKEYSITISKKG